MTFGLSGWPIEALDLSAGAESPTTIRGLSVTGTWRAITPSSEPRGISNGETEIGAGPSARTRHACGGEYSACGIGHVGQIGHGENLGRRLRVGSQNNRVVRGGDLEKPAWVSH
jgi:hypothetical protein